MDRLFGTDGVRGIANETLDSQLAFKLGKAGAYVLNKVSHHKPKIIVGMDTRISCDMLESALVAGICSTGAEALCAGIIPTPAIAHLVRKYGADAGIMISASHNPFEYNGIKFFSGDGFKLPDLIEDRIEKHLDGIPESSIPKVKGEHIGRRINQTDAAGLYAEHVRNTIAGDLDGMKIVLDCANGAAAGIAPRLFEDLGATVTTINYKPNGININSKCGSTHLEGLQAAVIKNKADIGIAFDGDADRMLAVDEKGVPVNGDTLIAILAMELKKQGKLADNTVVVTVMSNIGLDHFAEREGIKLVKSPVGDRYVLEAMVKGGFAIGGEQSGHIIMLEHNTTGDGLATALQFASVLKNTGVKTSELTGLVTIYPQVIVNAHVANEKKNGYLKNKKIAAACNALIAEFAGDGRVLIRPSGTEPLIRVMIEGKDRKLIDKKARELATLIEENLSS